MAEIFGELATRHLHTMHLAEPTHAAPKLKITSMSNMHD
jgi:hypothetical protein